MYSEKYKIEKEQVGEVGQILPLVGCLNLYEKLYLERKWTFAMNQDLTLPYRRYV